MTIQQELLNYYGTENWYRYGFGRMLITDGVKALIELAQAGWLLDAIASHQGPTLDVKADGFQVWTLKKNPKGSENDAVLICKADSNQPNLVKQNIPFTDFDFEKYGADEVVVWVEGVGNPSKSGEVSGRVALLPSEH